MFIVLTGAVNVKAKVNWITKQLNSNLKLSDQTNSVRHESGDVFGEECLYSLRKRMGNAKAAAVTELLTISLNDFVKIKNLGNIPSKIVINKKKGTENAKTIRVNWKYDHLRKLGCFKNSSIQKLYQLSNILEEVTVPHGGYVGKKGEVCKSMYVLYHGTVTMQFESDRDIMQNLVAGNLVGTELFCEFVRNGMKNLNASSNRDNAFTTYYWS
eukprot:g8506.t1